MQTIETQLHRQYAITATSPCTVTANDGMLLCTAQPGEQKIFTAISGSVNVSDPDAVISLLFGKFTKNSATDVPQPFHAGALPDILQAGHVYDLGVLSTDTDLTGLMFSSKEHVQTAELWFSTGSTAPNILWPDNCFWIGLFPALTTLMAYRFAIRQEPSGKLLINLAYEYPA